MSFLDKSVWHQTRLSGLKTTTGKTRSQKLVFECIASAYNPGTLEAELGGALQVW